MESKAENVTNNTETITISRAECDAFKAQKAYAAELEQKLDWLMEQMRPAKKQQLGASSEQSKYDDGSPSWDCSTRPRF